jgi:V-type H+-transporting ATPase subunit G
MSAIKQSNQGIQTLLEAEKEAAKIVAKARQCAFLLTGHLPRLMNDVSTDRVQRLKDAKTEALKEIESLKAEKQAQFLAAEKSNLGSVDSTQAQLSVDTDKKLLEIDAIFKKGKGAVIEKLLETAVECKPHLHVNAKLAC